MATKAKTVLKWLLDKTGGAVISWLWNHPWWAVSMLGPIMAGAWWVYRRWASIDWVDRLVLITLVTTCLGLLAVLGKWIVGMFRPKAPATDVAQTSPKSIAGLVFGAWLVIAVIALFWPQRPVAPADLGPASETGARPPTLPAETVSAPTNPMPKSPSNTMTAPKRKSATPRVLTAARKPQTSINEPEAEQFKTPSDKSIGGTTVGPVTVQPGAAASFGQQGGITASQFILSGQENTIKSVELRIQIDLPTEPLDPQEPSHDTGWRDFVALFDAENRRYRFSGPDFNFTNYQVNTNVHRVGFSYVPESSDGLVGQPISNLARMKRLLFDYGKFLRETPNVPCMDGTATLTLVVILNGIVVVNNSVTAPVQELKHGQRAFDVSAPFTNIESVYKQEALRRLAQ